MPDVPCPLLLHSGRDLDPSRDLCDGLQGVLFGFTAMRHGDADSTAREHQSAEAETQELYVHLFQAQRGSTLWGQTALQVRVRNAGFWLQTQYRHDAVRQRRKQTTSRRVPADLKSAMSLHRGSGAHPAAVRRLPQQIGNARSAGVAHREPRPSPRPAGGRRSTAKAARVSRAPGENPEDRLRHHPDRTGSGLPSCSPAPSGRAERAPSPHCRGSLRRVPRQGSAGRSGSGSTWCASKISGGRGGPGR